MSEQVLLRCRRLTWGHANDQRLFLGLVGAHLCGAFRARMRRGRVGWIVELVDLGGRSSTQQILGFTIYYDDRGREMFRVYRWWPGDPTLPR